MRKCFCKMMWLVHQSTNGTCHGPSSWQISAKARVALRSSGRSSDRVKSTRTWRMRKIGHPRDSKRKRTTITVKLPTCHATRSPHKDQPSASRVVTLWGEGASLSTLMATTPKTPDLAAARVIHQKWLRLMWKLWGMTYSLSRRKKTKTFWYRRRGRKRRL